MTKKNKVTINGIEVEILPDELVIASEAPIAAVRLSQATLPLDSIPGSKAGFYCHLCNAECILAPSGQAIYSVGKNPLLCLDCVMKAAEKGDDQWQPLIRPKTCPGKS